MDANKIMYLTGLRSVEEEKTFVDSPIKVTCRLVKVKSTDQSQSSSAYLFRDHFKLVNVIFDNLTAG
jgi:hypothetical protein